MSSDTTNRNKHKISSKIRKLWGCRTNSRTTQFLESPEEPRQLYRNASNSQPAQETNDNVQHQMFSGANNFNISGQPFFTAATNVSFNIGTFASKTQGLPSISDVLICPSSSQNFVGQEGILLNLEKIFSAKVVTVWAINADIMKSFMKRSNLKRSQILLDASSAKKLKKSIGNTVLPVSTNFLLVFENTDASLVIEDYIPATFPRIPVLVTSTDKSITHWASTGCAFELPRLYSQQEVDTIWNHIQQALEPRQNIISLVASGGSGKTQVALKFAEKNKSRFSNMWFFDANSHATLIGNFKELGKAAGIGEEVNEVKEYLSRSHNNWLCIFDNADDPDVFLHDYIPSCKHGNIIITSRLTETSQMDSVGWHINFENLSREDATILLLKLTGNQNSSRNVKQATKIVDTLGCHALAVATAGAYIYANSTCTLENYLTIYHKKQKNVLKYRTRLDNYPQTVLSAFEMSFERLHKQTQHMLQICSFFHPTAIPIQIFTCAAEFTESDLDSSVDLNPPIQAIQLVTEFLQLFGDDWSWDDSVNELYKFSLAVYNMKSKSLELHSVIQACAHQTLQPKNDIIMQQVAMLLLGRATPQGEAQGDYEFRRQLLIHAILYQESDFPTIRVKSRIAWILGDNGFFLKAEELQNQILLAYMQRHGKQHPGTFQSMANLAVTYSDLGKYKEAEKLQVEVLEHHKKMFGEHHSDTVKFMTNLAVTYTNLGKFAAAQELQEEVLVLCKQMFGEQDPMTLASMANLATTYSRLGKLTAAEKLQEEVLMFLKQILGEYHPDTLSAMSNLVITYSRLGKFALAAEWQEKVLVLHKQTFGEHHPLTLASMSSMARRYFHLGKYVTAERLDEEVLGLRKQILGDQHPDTLGSMANLGITYFQLGKFAAAKALQEEVLVLRKQILGEQHPLTLNALENLDITCFKLGNFTDGEKLAEEILALRRQTLGQHHPDTLNSMVNLSARYFQVGKFSAAEKLEEEVVVLRKQRLGEHHPDTIISMGNLAATYSKLGKWKAAAELGEEILVIRKQILGEHHPDTMTSMLNLAAIYSSMGEWEAVAKLGEEILVLRRQILGEHHPDTLDIMRILANIYRDLGKFEAAARLEELVRKNGSS